MGAWEWSAGLQCMHAESRHLFSGGECGVASFSKTNAGVFAAEWNCPATRETRMRSRSGDSYRPAFPVGRIVETCGLPSPCNISGFHQVGLFRSGVGIKPIFPNRILE